MPLFKESLTDTVERLLFRTAIVTASNPLAGHFREIVVAGEELKNVKWVPGQQVQFHLESLKPRTYTPMIWDTSAGTARFLFFLHGNGPGAEWATTLKRGDRCHLIGPHDSLDFTGIEGPTIFFGDETSIAAAQALRLAHRNPENQYFFEMSSLVESEEVMRCLGFTNVRLFQKLPNNAHLSEIEKELTSASWRIGLPHWVLTGKAQSIQILKSQLSARQAFFHRPKIRAYWTEDKTKPLPLRL